MKMPTHYQQQSGITKSENSPRHSGLEQIRKNRNAQSAKRRFKPVSDSMLINSDNTSPHAQAHYFYNLYLPLTGFDYLKRILQRLSLATKPNPLAMSLVLRRFRPHGYLRMAAGRRSAAKILPAKTDPFNLFELPAGDIYSGLPVPKKGRLCFLLFC